MKALQLPKTYIVYKKNVYNNTEGQLYVMQLKLHFCIFCENNEIFIAKPIGCAIIRMKLFSRRLTLMGARDNQEIKIKKDWCKGCGICVAFCPKQVLGYDDEGKVAMLDRDNCIKCGQCEMRCPDFAIFLGGKDNE